MVKDDSTLNIVLIEDNDEHAEIFRYCLEQQPQINILRRISDGELALSYFDEIANNTIEEQPDLVLLDMNLPRVNGIEVLQRIKSEAATKHIPVVMLTTSDSRIDKAQAYINHVNSYLVKPMEFEEVSSLMRVLCTYWGQWNRPPEYL